jgi:hypothetical protein
MRFAQSMQRSTNATVFVPQGEVWSLRADPRRLPACVYGRKLESALRSGFCRLLDEISTEVR